MSDVKRAIDKKRANFVLISKNGKEEYITLPEFGEVTIKIQDKVPVNVFKTERINLN